MHIDIQRLREQFQERGTFGAVPLGHIVISWSINLRYVAAILFRKPRLLLKILSNFFLGKVLKVKNRTFRTMTIAVDYTCNYRCDHCNISLMQQEGKEILTLSDYKKIDKELEKYGVLSYALTGGEPLMSPRLLEVLATLRCHEKLILIQTNAALLTEKVAKSLYDAGVDILCISIDSMHSFQRTQKEGIDFEWYDVIVEIAKKAGLKVQLLYVVNNENINDGEFGKVINYCFDRRVMLLFNPPIPLGRWKDSDELLITEENSRFIRLLEKKTPYARTDHKSNIKGYGCPAFKEKLYMTPYGDIQGCTFLQFSLGNIKDEALSVILERVSLLDYFHTYIPVCPPAEDREFIEDKLRVINKTHRYPVSLERFLATNRKVGKQ